MDKKEQITNATDSEKTEELNKCLSRYGEISDEGKKNRRRIFLTGKDLPLNDPEVVFGMIQKDVSSLKLRKMKLKDKKVYEFHYLSDKKDDTGEKIPYLDIELLNRY